MKKYNFSAIIPFFLLILLCSNCGGKSGISWEDVKSPSYKGDNITLNVYLENTGSMDGYMIDGSQLKDAVYGYATDLESLSKKMNLFYINTQVCSYNGDLKTFVRDMTPAKMHHTPGDKSYSEISDMLKMVLDSTKQNTVSIFISDCILDIAGADAVKNMNIARTNVQSVFNAKRNKLKDLAVEVYHMESDFEGMYYYQKGGEKISGKRPYYMWVIGGKDNLAYFKKNVQYNLGEHGMKNMVAFSPECQIPFTLLNGFGQKQQKDHIEPSTRGNEISFIVKADLRPTLQSDKSVCDVKNYSFRNNFLSIEEVTPCTDKISEDGKYTHTIKVTSTKGQYRSCPEVLSFKPSKSPSWLDDITDESGANVTANMAKTTGIKYIISGVADAYAKEKNSATVKIKIVK